MCIPPRRLSVCKSLGYYLGRSSRRYRQSKITNKPARYANLMLLTSLFGSEILVTHQCNSRPENCILDGINVGASTRARSTAGSNRRGRASPGRTQLATLSIHPFPLIHRTSSPPSSCLVFMMPQFFSSQSSRCNFCLLLELSDFL